jgi:hypothetical protein
VLREALAPLLKSFDVPSTIFAAPWSMRSKRTGSSGFTFAVPPMRSIFTCAGSSFA